MASNITAEDVKRGGFHIENAPQSSEYKQNETASETTAFQQALNPIMKSAAQTFLWSKEDWSNEANRLSQKINVPADLLMASGHNGIKRAGEAAAQLDRGATLDDVYSNYPELQNIQYKNQTEAIQTLNNLESVKSTRGLFDAVKQGIWSMNDQILLGKAGYKLSQSKDPNEINNLQNEVKRLQGNLEQYRKPDDFTTRIASEGLSQVYQMGVQGINGLKRVSEGMALGASAGAATGAIFGGVGAAPGALAGGVLGASIGLQTGMAEQMYQSSYGLKYLELMNKKDETGKNIYSKEEANRYAMSYAVPDAAIEFVATKFGAKAVAAATPKRQLAKAVADIATGRFSTFDKGIGVTVAEMMKSGIKSGSSELFEEGLQDVNEKLQHNLWRKQGDIPSFGIGDIAAGATSAMWDAVPAILGMGLLGGAGGGLRTIKELRDFRNLAPEQREILVQNEINQRGNQLISNLANDGKSNQLAEQNPELYQKLVQAQGDKIGVSTTYINAHELVDSEQGQVALQDLVNKGIVSQEEVAMAIENEAPIEIPIGQFAQEAKNLEDTTIKELQNTTFYTEGGISLNTIKKSTETTRAIQERFAGEYQKRQEAVKQDVMESSFNDATETEKEVLELVLQDPYNIKKSFNEIYNSLSEDYRETYATEHEHINKSLETDTKPKWYQDYVAENKKAPGNRAKRRKAYEVSRQETMIDLGADLTPEAAIKLNTHFDEMGHKLEVLEAMDKMKDKLFAVADSDVYLRASLSKEGLDVYNQVKETLKNGNLEVAGQSKEGALIFASHADVMAHIMQKAGHRKFTALDYLDKIQIQHDKKYQGGKGFTQEEVKLADEKLKEHEFNWSNTIDSFMNGEQFKGNLFVMDSPLVFELAGIDLKQIKIAPSILDKILRMPVYDEKGKLIKQGHGNIITPEVLKQIPRALTEPLVLYKFKENEKDKALAVLRLTDTDGNHIICPLILDNKFGNDEYHLVQSVYEKRSETMLLGHSLDIKYLNKKEGLAFLTAIGSQSPQRVTLSPSFIESIPDEKDLRKLKEDGKEFYQKEDSVINKFNQGINGLTSVYENGIKLIQLFDIANFSTFVHESGHVFLEDLRMLADMDNAPKQIRDDWKKVMEWTGYVEGADADTNRKAHEKFATGFEAYLREGNAPTKALQRVFRRFKEWLVALYHNVTELGGVPPKEIQDVMARMLATQEDINSWSIAKELDSFEETGLFKQLDEIEQANLNKYLDDVKEGAKEKVMKAYIKELLDHPMETFNSKKEEIQANIEKSLVEKYPVYKNRMMYNLYGIVGLKESGFNSIETLEKAEKVEGIGAWDKVIASEMKAAQEEYERPIIDSNMAQELAEEWILSEEGQQRLTIEEANTIKKRTNAEVAKKWNLISKLESIDANAENFDEEIKKLVKEDKSLDLKETKKEQANEKSNGPQELIEQLKKELKDQIQNMRALRNMEIGQVEDMMERAHRSLANAKISNAISFKNYQRKSVTEARLADISLSKGKMDEAFYHKQQQLFNQAMARAAYENDVEVRELKDKLQEQNNRISRPKQPVRIDPSSRYFYQHLMYQLGFTSLDGPEPLEGFNLSSVLKMLDPDAELLGQENSVMLDKWILDLFEGKEQKSWHNLTMEQFKTLEELMTAIYTQGRQQFEGSRILDEKGERVSFDQAVEELLAQGEKRFAKPDEDLLNKMNSKTWKEKASDTAGGALLALTKMETVLRRLDNGEVGVWNRYIYEPINRATNKGKEMLEKATKDLANTVKVYSKKELFNIRNERMYQVGKISNMSKEQVICLALNWGTQANRQRAMETVKADEVEIMKSFQEILNDKDWAFIIRIWEQINSYFDERSAVQERLYGSPMRKEKGIKFKIGGREIEGQYYPIVYDPTIDGAAKDYEIEDIVRSQMSSNAVWGMGMSATKQRAQNMKNKKLLLNFNVIPSAITEAINHIAMREAATEVNKIITNRDIEQLIKSTLGAETHEMMKRWVRDNWQTEISRSSKWDRFLQYLRKQSTFAIMGYRTSTALLNVLNVIPMTKEIGVINTIQAIKSNGVGFAGKGTSAYQENRDFAMNKSIFLRERIHNLDRDLQQGLDIGGKGLDYIPGGKAGEISYKYNMAKEARDKINNYAYSFITETDLMISVPLWRHAYDTKVAELITNDKLSHDVIEQEAIAAGDRAVRRVFGSGDTKDSAEIQRNKNSIIALFTPFYTYCNTVFNALIEGGYELKDKKNLAPLMNAMLYWIVIQGIGEGLIRSMWDGDDDDVESILKKTTGAMGSNLIGGLPIVRDVIGTTMAAIFGNKVYSKGNEVVALSLTAKLADTISTAKSDKKDWVDLMRLGGQATNRIIGFSDTLSDGFWTLAKLGVTNTDATVQDVAMAIAFDRQLKSKKDKKKEKSK